MAKPKYDINDIRKIVESKNGTLLSDQYRILSDRVKIRCNVCKREWKPMAAEIVRGSWCPSCTFAILTPKQIERFVLKNTNGIVLSDIDYRLYSDKIEIECVDCSTKWKAILSCVKCGQKCPKCFGIRPYGIEDVCNILEKRDIVLLTDYYINNKQKLKLKCVKCDYIWKTAFSKLNPNNSEHTGCPKCAGNVKYTNDYVKKFIKNKGGVLLSDYQGANDKIKIKCCDCGEIWNPNFATVHNRTAWCPTCNRKNSKSQRELTDILKDIFSDSIAIHTNYKNFDWLKTSQHGKQEIDIFIIGECGTTVGVEYDGEQHFMPIRFGSMSQEDAEVALVKRKKLDILKDDKIKNHNDCVNFFVRFSYKDVLDKASVKKKLMENDIPIF